jgi:hypothetical protein
VHQHHPVAGIHYQTAVIYVSICDAKLLGFWTVSTLQNSKEVENSISEAGYVYIHR